MSDLVFREGARGCEEKTDRLVAYFEVQDESSLRQRLQAGLEQIRTAGLPVPDAEITVTPLEEEDWSTAWWAHFTPLVIKDTLVIRPPWEKREETASRVEVVITPGQAFGTGHHATTRLMLEALVERAPSLPPLALDVGTGSGILAISHALLAPFSQVFACDIDPLAIANTVANARLNRVADRIHCWVGSLEALLPTTYPLIYANLQRSIILPLLPAFARHLSPGGHLLLSGILSSEEGMLREAITAHPLFVTRVRRLDDWILLEVVRGS